MEVLQSMFTKGLPFPSKIIYDILTWYCKTTEFWELEKEQLLTLFFCYILQKGVTVVYSL